MLTQTKKRFFNKLQMIQAFNRRQYDVGYVPPVITIEVSSMCNLNCFMCGRDTRWPRKVKNMSFEIYRKILDEISSYVELVSLHGSGEPLLNKELPRMIEYASRKGVKTLLSTNATLLDEKMSLDLIASGIHVILFAVDGTNEKTYEAIRLGARFQEVMKNIESFIHLKMKNKRANPKIVIQLIEMERNKKEVPDFLNYWSRFPVIPFIKPSVERHKVLTKLERQLCDRLWHRGYITSDGDVLPCCIAHYSAGNITDMDFIKIWHGEKMRKFRQMHIRNKNNRFCSTCNYVPPRTHTALSNTCCCLFDFGFLAKTLYKIGYKRRRQL